MRQLFRFSNHEDTQVAGQQFRADIHDGLIKMKQSIIERLPRILTKGMVCETPECRDGKHRRTEHGAIGCLCAIASTTDDGGIHIGWCPCKKVYD